MKTNVLWDSNLGPLTTSHNLDDISIIPSNCIDFFTRAFNDNLHQELLKADVSSFNRIFHLLLNKIWMEEGMLKE